MALVLTLTAGVTQLVDLYVLRPYGLEYLRLFALLLVVGAAVGVVELALRRFSPVLQRVLGSTFRRDELRRARCRADQHDRQPQLRGSVVLRHRRRARLRARIDVVRRSRARHHG